MRSASASLAAVTITSVSGSTTHAARVPTAALTMVTLSEPGTCSWMRPAAASIE